MAWLPTPDKLFEAVTGEQGQFVLPAVLSFTEGVGGIASGVILVLFLSIYWSINQIHFERLWLSLLPSEQRKQARGVWRTIEPNLGAYIRSEIVQSLLAGLLLGLGYWLLGSQYPILMALIGALAWLIPLVGAPLAVILIGRSRTAREEAARRAAEAARRTPTTMVAPAVIRTRIAIDPFTSQTSDPIVAKELDRLQFILRQLLLSVPSIEVGSPSGS